MTYFSDFESSELSAETRMEMPSASYEQELLATPVPFENRVAFLQNFLKESREWRTQKAIANYLTVDEEQVDVMADIVGAQSKFEAGRRIYEPYTREVLEEEMGWQAYFDQLDDYVSTDAIAFILDRPVAWVRRHAYSLGVSTEEKIGRNGHSLSLYGKGLVQDLRHVLLHFPPANDWLDMEDLQNITGRSNTWIRQWVEKEGIKTQDRISTGSVRVTRHYASEAIALFQAMIPEARPPAAGDWVSLRYSAQKIGASRAWVRQQINEMGIQGELRCSSESGRPTVHYPPETLDALIAAYNERPQKSAGWLTAHGLAELLGKDIEWVQARVGEYTDKAEVRLSKAGKPSVCYPPEVITALWASAIEYSPAGNWLTENGIAESIGRTFKWVRARIEPYEDLGEVRLSRGNNRPKTHYPPEVRDALHRKSIRARSA